MTHTYQCCECPAAVEAIRARSGFLNCEACQIRWATASATRERVSRRTHFDCLPPARRREIRQRVQ
jgi:hypothetical protein